MISMELEYLYRIYSRMKVQSGLFLIKRNEFVTISEFFHWFKLKRSTKYLFAFSENILLTLPSADLHGFSNRQGVLVLKI